MATKTTKTTQATETKKEFKLEQVLVLWKNKSKDGKKTYFTGHTEDGRKITAFYNTRKKNPKEPDMRIYETHENRELSKEPVCSLWCNVSEKTSKKYLTGTFNGKKVVGFIYEGKNEKAPYLSVYYREDGNFVKEEKEEEQVDIDDLPFLTESE